MIKSTKIKRIIKRMLNKSTEAFILGLEIYNKPTIHYRTEGFSFFICNAWELMLKAYLIKNKGLKSIYFKDKTNRTISLHNTLTKIYTNKYSPIRQNLQKIIDLRNVSTHFITEDYEYIYAPLFQANVLNFVHEMYRFHQIDITKKIPNNFLSISIQVKKPSTQQIRAKYSPEVAQNLINTKNKLKKDEDKAYRSELNSNQHNLPFAIPIRTSFYITKNPKKADMKIKISHSAKVQANMIKKVVDKSKQFPHAAQDIERLVNKRLRKSKIHITNSKYSHSKQFTSYDFNLFNKFYNIKKNKKLSYDIPLSTRYLYSNKLVDFIFTEIKDDPKHIIQKLRKGIKKR